MGVPRRLLAAVCALAATAACGGSAADGGEGSAQDGASLAEITRLTDTIEEAQRASIRSCMAGRGFPQLIQAEELAVRVQPAAQYDAVRIDPLDLGPYTEEHARKYGIVGTELLFSDGEPGSVISADAAYDKAEEACRDALDGRAKTDVEALIAGSTELRNRVRAEFAARVRPQVDQLMRERLRCVSERGYPALDIDAVLGADTLEDSLGVIGVPVGKLVKDHPKSPRVNKGEVAVVPPPRPTTYTPSAPEVAFALAYVECGKKLRTVERLDEMQRAPRQEVLAKHELELSELTDKLRKMAAAIGNHS